MTPDEARQAVREGSRAVLRYASPDLQSWPHGWGRVVAYSEAPQVCVEDPTGARVWWRADLTDLSTAEPTTVVHRFGYPECGELHGRMVCQRRLGHAGDHEDYRDVAQEQR